MPAFAGMTECFAGTPIHRKSAEPKLPAAAP